MTPSHNTADIKLDSSRTIESKPCPYIGKLNPHY